MVEQSLSTSNASTAQLDILCIPLLRTKTTRENEKMVIRTLLYQFCGLAATEDLRNRATPSVRLTRIVPSLDDRSTSHIMASAPHDHGGALWE